MNKLKQFYVLGAIIIHSVISESRNYLDLISIKSVYKVIKKYNVAKNKIEYKRDANRMNH